MLGRAIRSFPLLKGEGVARSTRRCVEVGAAVDELTVSVVCPCFHHGDSATKKDEAAQFF